MYHPYANSPSALTEYLKQKLHSQHAKHLSCSLPAQAEQNVPLECNKLVVTVEGRDMLALAMLEGNSGSMTAEVRP